MGRLLDDGRAVGHPLAQYHKLLRNYDWLGNSHRLGFEGYVEEGYHQG